MSLNTSHTPDGRGVLIYNGEMILLYSSVVKMSFSGNSNSVFKGGKSGSLYLTSHRIIFMNESSKDALKSFAMPFHTLQNVKLEQPILAPNYLKGLIQGLPGGNFDGEVTWKLSFPKGGCVDFGKALLRANDLASRARPFAAPPAYNNTPTTYYTAPPTYYIPPPGAYQGFQAPTHAFPEQPPAGNVYMYDAPPPYVGIAPSQPNPQSGMQYAGGAVPPYPAGGPAPFPAGPSAPGYPQAGPPAYANVPPVPGYNAYQQAGPLPEKQ